MLDLFQEDFRKQQPETLNKNHIADIFNFKASEYKMQQAEAEANKKTSNIIGNLVQKRIENQDNTFLVLTEMDSFEKQSMYQDTWPLLDLRKKLWLVWAYFILFCQKVITHSAFESFIIFTIMANCIFLAMEDPTTDESTTLLDIANQIFLIIYSIEMFLKIFALGFFMRKGSYLRDSWNILDFVVVVSAYLPLIMPNNNSGFSLASLRSLRILRPLRTVSKLKNLKALIVTVFNSIPYLVEILVVMFFMFLVFAIAALQLFRGLLQNRCFEETTGIPHKDDNLCGGKYTCPTDYVCGKMGFNPNFEATGFDDIITSLIVVF